NEKQADERRKVKRAKSGMIIDAVNLKKENTVGDAQKTMREYSIGGIPITDDNGVLIGIVTNRDLRFEKDYSHKLEDVMTKDGLVTVAPGTSLEQAEIILQKHKIEKLPVVDEHGVLKGLITFRDITKLTQKPIANKDNYGRLRVAAALGVTADVVERAEALVQAQVDAVIVATAHGHTKGVVEVLKQLKEKFPNLDVVVG